MTRAELTEKLLDIKREKSWSWKQICSEIGGMSPVLITGALLGQMKLTKPQAAKAAELFGSGKSEQSYSTKCRIAVRPCRRQTRSFTGSMNW
jgi:cyanate lyase